MRSPLEPDEVGPDLGIYTVATRHSPVEMRQEAPRREEEETSSFGHGPSVFGSDIPLHPSAQTASAAVLPEQQPLPYYPYSPFGRRSPSPGEVSPLLPRGPPEGSNAPPTSFSASHQYSKTPYGGPLVSAPDSSTGFMVFGRHAPPSAYTAAIISDGRQPSSEGHGSKRGPELATPSGQVILPPNMGYAYEPEPVTWNHRIVGATPVGSTHDHTTPASIQNPQVSVSAMQQDQQSNRGSATNLSVSLYSQDGETESDIRPTLHVVNDPRISPELGIRLRGSLASEQSFGPQDHEDYSRRVAVGCSPCSPPDLYLLYVMNLDSDDRQRQHAASCHSSRNPPFIRIDRSRHTTSSH